MRKIVINTESSFDFDYFTFDCMTRGRNARAFKFVGTWYQGQYRRFDSPEAFWEWVKTLEGKHVYGYAYEAIYDLCSLLPNPLYDVSNYIDRGGRFICGKVGKVTFVDAANIIHSMDTKDEAMRAVAERYGLEHVPPPQTRQPEITEAEVNKSQSNVKNLHTVLERFFQFVGEYCRPRPLTLASNAVRIWQERYCPIAEPHPRGLQILVSDLDDRFRTSYYGGRSEVFNHGKHENISAWDVHSMYPYAMTLRYPVPSLLRHRTDQHLSQSEFEAILQTCEGMAEGVAVTGPQPTRYGPLPLRLRDEEKVIFPLGKFHGAWCFPEIRELLRRGGTFHFYNATWSEETCTPFKDFVEEFYAIRMASGNAWEQFQTKILLNATYGKLGQAGLPRSIYRRARGNKPGKEESAWEWIPFSLEDDGPGMWYLENTSSHSYQSILSFAAYTTSYARVIHLNGLASSSALYGDTDSCFAWDFPQEMLHEKAIGTWRKQETYKWAQFWTPKTYQAQTSSGELIRRCKGVPREFVGQLFAHLAKGHQGMFMRRLKTPKEAALTESHDYGPGSPMWMYRRIPTVDTKRCWALDTSTPHQYAIKRGENARICC